MSTTELGCTFCTECRYCEFWTRYAQNKTNLEIRNQLVEGHMQAVEKTAKKIKKRLPSEVELVDLISDGYLGLVGAVEDFDLSRGVKFATYCVPRIRGAILDGIREMDWVPRLIRERRNQLVRVKKSLGKSKFKEIFPTKEDVVGVLGVKVEEAERIMADGSSRDAKIFPLVKMQRGEDYEGEPWVRGVGHASIDHIEAPDKDEQKPLDFDSMIACLPRKVRAVFKRYYMRQQTMKEAGMALGLSESRISQMHANAIELLKGFVARRFQQLGLKPPKQKTIKN